jgi:hypothetical protein
MQASPGRRFLLLPIIVSCVNRERYRWSATLTWSVRSVKGGIPGGATYFACENRSFRQLARHVGEPRQVQLVCDGHRLGRAVTVLGQNQVRLAAARVVPFEGIRSV